jgi:hypothetical protein
MILLWKVGIIGPVGHRAVSRLLGRQKSIAVFAAGKKAKTAGKVKPSRVVKQNLAKGRGTPRSPADRFAAFIPLRIALAERARMHLLDRP